jgi:hypothetical protein
MQLYCPKPGSNKSIIALLDSSKEIQVQDILEYLNGKNIEKSLISCYNKLDHDMEKFHERRKQRVHFASLVERGGAQLDANLRLVLHRGPNPLPDLQPDHPPMRGNVHGQNEDIQFGRVVPPAIPLLLDNDEEDQRFSEIEERAAAETISQMVHSYRNEKVPEESFFLISIKENRQPPDSVILTFRRILIAIFSIFIAITCVIVQSFPIPSNIPISTSHVDKLLPELLHVRDFAFHLRNCLGLQWEANPITSMFTRISSTPDCSDGVLIIPSIKDLGSYYQSFNLTENYNYGIQKYTTGINLSWNLHCEIPVKDEKYKAKSERKCFRGIHDGFVSDEDMENAIRLGASLIWNHGSDHFDIHHDVSLLHSHLSHLVNRIRSLLETTYLDTDTQIQPVAFRIHAALPMDAAGIVRGSKSSNLLSQIVNKSNYINWLDFNKKYNEAIMNSMSPFPSYPIRESCNLIADLEANSTFAIHTSIFLSNGAGDDFEGGHLLFIDNFKYQNPRKRINKGVVIDGSKGRIIVSSGGPENLRCRLPTRTGIRAVLQIWWNIRNLPKFCQ